MKFICKNDSGVGGLVALFVSTFIYYLFYIRFFEKVVKSAALRIKKRKYNAQKHSCIVCGGGEYSIKNGNE